MEEGMSNPVAFAAGEAIADRAVCVLIAWETAGEIKWRTYPEGSRVVMIGLHAMLGAAIEATSVEAADDDNGED
jgi:hypothetical protein